MTGFACQIFNDTDLGTGILIIHENGARRPYGTASSTNEARELLADAPATATYTLWARGLGGIYTEVQIENGIAILLLKGRPYTTASSVREARLFTEGATAGGPNATGMLWAVGLHGLFAELPIRA